MSVSVFIGQEEKPNGMNCKWLRQEGIAQRKPHPRGSLCAVSVRHCPGLIRPTGYLVIIASYEKTTVARAYLI